MTLTRRSLLAGASAGAAVLAAPTLVRAAYAPRPGPWRRFEIVTRVTLPREGAAAQVWVPVPDLQDPLWSRDAETRWKTDADAAELARAEGGGPRLVHARWSEGAAPGRIEVVSTVETRSRSVDLDAPASVAPLSREERAHHTAATEWIPTDGIVRETAEGIVAGAEGDLDKARRIYDWVVEATERNPETRGCGLGDVASMLHTGDLTGKCADLNALYVGLARAAGLPARDLYGLRVAPSAFGYRSLGAGSSDVTGAQHCRADVFVEGYGWIPVDPADVRKVVLEEPPKTLSLTDAKVREARAGLFGAAEGNWVAFSTAHDVTLPGASFGPIPFLMYPNAEIGEERRDELDPARFAYTITARELSA